MVDSGRDLKRYTVLDVVLFLEKIAFLYGKKGDNHKSNAFFRSAEAIKKEETDDVYSITWSSIDGIGKSIELEITAFLVTGTSSRFEFLGGDGDE